MKEKKENSKKGPSNSTSDRGTTKPITDAALKRNIIIVAVAATGLTVFMLYVYHIFGTINPLYIVTSGSMVPNLNIGDLLIIKQQHVNYYPFSNLKLGDIIIFKTPGVNVTGRHETVVHRVAEIRDDTQGTRTIRTKGDANPTSVPLLDYPIREANYIGKVVYVIPKIGLVTQILRPPINIIIIGAIILTIVYYLRKEQKKSHYNIP